VDEVRVGPADHRPRARRLLGIGRNPERPGRDGRRQGVIVWDISARGWFHLVLGAIMLLTACGLWTMRSWAHWSAVGLAAVSAITQVGVLPAFPLWALIVIGLEVIVTYGLTARWGARA
jgi:hypothetical protein